MVERFVPILFRGMIEKVVELTVKDEKRWEDDIGSLLGRMNGAGIPPRDAVRIEMVGIPSPLTD